MDLANKQVEAHIEHNGTILIRVITDLSTGEQQEDGNWDEIIQITPSMPKDTYLQMFNEWATIFIKEGISDPEKYFDQH